MYYYKILEEYYLKNIIKEISKIFLYQSYIYELRDSAVQNIILSDIDALYHFAWYHIPHAESGKAWAANFTEFRNYTLSFFSREPKPLSSRAKLLKLRRFYTSVTITVRALIHTYVHPTKADLWVFSSTTNDQLAIQLNYLETSFELMLLFRLLLNPISSFLPYFFASVDVIVALSFW